MNELRILQHKFGEISRGTRKDMRLYESVDMEQLGRSMTDNDMTDEKCYFNHEGHEHRQTKTRTFNKGCFMDKIQEQIKTVQTTKQSILQKYQQINSATDQEST